MTDKETARQQVAALVEKFQAEYKRFTAPSYNETEVRIQFINPMFEALGWDMADSKGRHEVFHEYHVEVDESGKRRNKRPDYAFSIGNQTRFFVEAKKPFVNLKDDPSPAYQTRRYGWSARLPLSILTDFEEFIVYDCRIRPDEEDKPTKGRLHYYTYTEYSDKWDEIFDLFSYEAVQANSLVKAVQGTKPRGTVTVDDAFLNEMEVWRKSLAEDIALHNPDLNRRQLNMAVQTTIDRIVFLRICEDRDIEQLYRLRDYGRGKHVYANLMTYFSDADRKYNSGLFHFSDEDNREEPDTITPKLTISDGILHSIIRRLYYPSPYAFAVIPADILGQIYERFLGKVIELTPGGGATVVEKPEVRKAGGVFYTPTYIVDYIVQNTIGKLVEGKTPDQVAKLRILDPACGSGSFLIGAYQFLLDWHLAYYNANDPTKYLKRLRLTASTAPAATAVASYVLNTAEKKRILLNNLYGVDLDQQAVEVTKLSLLLKVLEGETAVTAQPELFAERVLPDLGDNIKWGNSLIGPEYYIGKMFPDEEEIYRLKTFDWGSKTEGFGTIMAAGGFDAVIGNPPYIRIQTMMEWAAESVTFYDGRYIAASKGNYDIYVIFVEKALSLLNKNGLMGYILPHKFFNAQYGEPLRGIIAKGKHLAQIVHFGHQQIFANAATYTCLLFLEKHPREKFAFMKVEDLSEWRAIGQFVIENMNNSNVSETEWNFSVGETAALFDKLRNNPTHLSEVAHIFQGLITGADKVFTLSQLNEPQNGYVTIQDTDSNEWKLETGILKPFIKDITVSSYILPSFRNWLLFPYRIKDNKAYLLSPNEIKNNFPNAWAYLENKAQILRKREGGSWDHESWYAFGRSQNLTQMDSAKIIVQVISLTGKYAYDNSGIYFTGGGNGPYYGIRWLDPDNLHSIHYLQAVLTSKLVDMYLHSISSPFRGGYWSYGKRFIEQLPIRTINFDDPVDKAAHDRIVQLVETMLELHKQLAAASSPQVAKTIQSVIDSTDRQIDQLVYQLYDLTPEEIALVEGQS